MKMKQHASLESLPAFPSGFTDLLGEVKLRIQSAQTKAMVSVNAELIQL